MIEAIERTCLGLLAEFAAVTVWVEYAQFVAAALASIYTLILIGEWVWKKFIREFCELRGWVARIRRRKTD